MKKCYRIIDDKWSLEKMYIVQIRKKFLGVKWWKQCAKFRGFLFSTNAFSSIKKAKKWIKAGCPKNEKINKTLWQSNNC